MGNGGSSLFSDYVLDDALPVDSDVPWKLHQAISKDGTHMSVFVYDEAAVTGEGGSKNNLSQYIENAVKYMRVLRHPGIVKLLDIEYESKATYILTEEVTPLSLELENLSNDEICAGIHSLLATLTFLHETAQLCHNNVCGSSVFVGKDGTWKLGSLEHMCRFQDATPGYLSKHQLFRSLGAIPVEEKSGTLPDQKLYGHTRDAFAFGMLAEQLLEQLSKLGDMTKTFELRIQDECLSDNPRQRPQMSNLMDDRLFKNDYTEIVHFLKSVMLKSVEEKDLFFRTLVPKLRKMSPGLVATRLVRPLLARFVLCEPAAEKFLLSHLLTPQSDAKDARIATDAVPLLPEHLFKKHVVPEIFKIFHVQEAHVRKVLLRHFPGYVHCFEADVLQKVIMPQILMGMRDTDDEIVYFTMHALAELVPVLGGAIVIGGTQAKIFSEGTPKFKKSSAEPTNHILNSKLPTSQPKKSIMKDLNAASKQAERELRREEARLRREERKRQQELRRKQGHRKVDEADVNGVTRENGDDESEHSHPSPQQHNSYHGNNGHNNVNSSVTSNAKEEDDDNDHDDDDDDDVDDVDDDVISESDIDKEIEEQISAMQSTLSPVGQSRLEDSETYEPPPKVDWSDAVPISRIPGRTLSGKGVLKLNMPKAKTKTSPPPDVESRRDSAVSNEDKWDTWGSERTPPSAQAKPKGILKRNDVSPDDWGSGGGWGTEPQGEDPGSADAGGWGDSWGEVDQQNVSPKSPTTVPMFSSLPKKAQDQSLGAEFDIMSLKIKKPAVQASLIDDFFADMEPDFKPKENLMDALSEGRHETADGSTDDKTLFAVQEAAEDAAGWGDDLDWDVPED